MDPNANPLSSPDSSPDGSPSRPAVVSALNTAPPPPTFPATVIQTVHIRSHVPVVLDLAAANYTQWRRFFDTVIGKFGLRDHIDSNAVPRHHDPEWVMIDHAVVHWLYTTISPELLDVVMQPEDTALDVWTAIEGIFRDNMLARAVYIDAEYHALVQGDMTVMQYCTKLKSFTDQLRNLGQPVSEVQQVFNLLRGLGRQFHGAIPHITARVPLPTFLQTRSFLMLEEHRAEQSARHQAAHALMAARAPPPPSPTYGSSSNSNRNRGRGKNKGKDKGKAPVVSPPAPPAPSVSTQRPPAYPAPAPGANSWTGLVQAWPVPWRAPGAGVLGPRPGPPHQQALLAASSPTAMMTPGYGGLSYGSGYGVSPNTAPPPAYGSPGASSSNAPPQQQPWDMGPLHAALNSMATPSPPPGGSSDWYLDSGASSHMSSGSGYPNSGGDSPM